MSDSPLVPMICTYELAQLTEDLAALRQIMRLRGFSVMTNILEDYPQDIEIQTLVSERER